MIHECTPCRHLCNEISRQCPPNQWHAWWLHGKCAQTLARMRSLLSTTHHFRQTVCKWDREGNGTGNEKKRGIENAKKHASDEATTVSGACRLKILTQESPLGCTDRQTKTTAVDEEEKRHSCQSLRSVHGETILREEHASDVASPWCLPYKP